MAEKSALDVLKQSAKEFGNDDCTMMASSLSYYTVFSLPPMLFVIVVTAGFIFGRATVEEKVLDQARSMIGPAAAQQIQTMLEAVAQDASGGGWAMFLSIGALLFAATGVFMQLQTALNRTWEVMPDPEEGGVMDFITKRLLSFGMVLGIAFLLLVSLAASAAISALSGAIGALLPGGLSSAVLLIINFVLSLALFTLLFAAIFKWMPDAEIHWKDVWVGAGATAVLFGIGKLAIGFYLGQSNTSEAYGAAGALAIIMIWVYYASMILLFGAEFTQVWARTYGDRILPEEGAVRVVEDTRHVRRSEAEASSEGSGT